LIKEGDLVEGTFSKDIGIVVEVAMKNPDSLPNPLDNIRVFWFNLGIMEGCHRYELMAKEIK
jgi:hypothetical protein